MPLSPASALRQVFLGIKPVFSYWMDTEVHVFAFSIAANVLLSFFPFLIVCVSLGRALFNRDTVISAMDLAFRDFFPSAMGNFMHNNLPAPQPVELLSIFILLFSANGIFEPLEVALNKVWGIRKNRTFLRNQIVSLVLIFVCGTLVLLSLGLAAVRQSNLTDFAVERWISALFYKAAAVPVTVLVLFLVYRYLPNGRPPVERVLPAAIGVGVLLEALKTLNTWVWPVFDEKLQREYGVFRYSATLIFLSFLTSMLVLGGAEWAARGHRLDKQVEDSHS
ncbi:MAG: YihY/virulence factor BrkB family protein [Bryobacteraceae bacterium]